MLSYQRFTHNKDGQSAMENRQLNINKYIVILGALAAAVGICITLLLPAKASIAEGFFTPIIAFELARSPDDLTFLMGSSESASMMRQQFYDGITWDMLFPFLYGGFIFLLLVKALRIEADSQQWTTKLGVVSAATIPFFDVAENAAMLQILNALSAQGAIMPRFLQHLQLTTWLKWLAIGIAFGMLMLHFYTQARTQKTTKHIASMLVSGLCFCVTLAAFFTLHPLLGELMALSVVLCIAFFLVTNSRELIGNIKRMPSDMKNDT